MIAKKAPVGEDVSEGLEIFAQLGQERETEGAVQPLPLLRRCG